MSLIAQYEDIPSVKSSLLMSQKFIITEMIDARVSGKERRNDLFTVVMVWVGIEFDGEWVSDKRRPFRQTP